MVGHRRQQRGTGAAELGSVIEELSDPRSAFSIVMSRSPDLIVLDLMLPLVEGLGQD